MLISTDKQMGFFLMIRKGSHKGRDSEVVQISIIKRNERGFIRSRLHMDSGIRKMIKGLPRPYSIFVFNFLVHLENGYQGKALGHFNNSW